MGFIIRQEVASQLLDLAAVNDRANQTRQQIFLPVRAFWCGGQAEAIGGKAPNRRLHIRGAGQMMALIKNQQTEAIAETFEVDVGRMVGCHRQRLHLVFAAAEDADRPVERQQQFAVPLM